MRLYLPAAILVLLTAPSAARAADLPRGVSLKLELAKETAYPGERVPVAVILQVSGVAPRNVGYPRFSSKGLSVAGFPPPQQSEQGQGEDHVTLYRFDSALTAKAPGGKQVGPAQLDLQIEEEAQGRGAFFGAVTERNVTIASPAAALTVLPFPGSGRPASFSGAVGKFEMAVTARPETVSAGDPVTITTTIAGNGTLPSACPSATGAGWNILPPRVTSRGRQLTCEQVAIPVTPRSRPSVTCCYFDPESSGFRTLTRSLSAVRVLPAPGKTMGAPAPVPPAPARPKKEDSDGSNALVIVSMPVICGAGLWLLLKTPALRKEPALPPPQEPPSPLDFEAEVSAAERALEDGDVEGFYCRLFCILQSVVARSAEVPAATICMVPPGADFPRSAQIDSLFAKCHSVRYGGVATTVESMRNDIKELRSILRTLESPVAIVNYPDTP